MKTSLLTAALALTVFITHAQPMYPTLGTIQYDDPRFEKLIPKGTKLEVLASGFDWSEGPVWVKEGGYLLFSDVPQNCFQVEQKRIFY